MCWVMEMFIKILLVCVALVLVLCVCSCRKDKKSVNKDKKYPKDIDEILTQPKPLDIIFALQEKIGQKLASSGFESLTIGERTFLCVDGIESQVNNGGFDQYFFNTTGNLAQGAPAAFEAIGAEYTAKLVRQACSVFPDEAPPNDQNKRQELFEQIGKDKEEFLYELDKQFYEYKDNLRQLLIEYIRKNKEQFK